MIIKITGELLDKCFEVIGRDWVEYSLYGDSPLSSADVIDYYNELTGSDLDYEDEVPSCLSLDPEDYVRVGKELTVRTCYCYDSENIIALSIYFAFSEDVKYEDDDIIISFDTEDEDVKNCLEGNSDCASGIFISPIKELYYDSIERCSYER